MSKNPSLQRKAHFLGTKIRHLRRQHDLTLEDLSVRCVQIDAERAPSVSYLSMIERGKRVPSEDMLALIASVFQKDAKWFLDEGAEATPATPAKKRASGIAGMPLEPSFLYSKEHLQIAIPEMLAQTGTTGRQFAHLLIRAHQEHHQNRFPDLEQAAESVGGKQLPMHLDDVVALSKKLGLQIRWFDRPPMAVREDSDPGHRTLIRSFFEPPNVLYVNRRLEAAPERLKYDLATHIGHAVLHDGDGMRSVSAAGPGLYDEARHDGESQMMDAQDILFAWRDFECSFFAGALLCPRIPFRQFLARTAHRVDLGDRLEVSSSLLMRRMTAVASYPHWHYFDAYPPGRLHAVYRGNGIPLPWGNMTPVLDPCRHWAVFRMLNSRSRCPAAQISVLRNGDDARLYCCESVQVRDLSEVPHVLCAGVDLAPALESLGRDPQAVIAAIEAACEAGGGQAPLPSEAKHDLSSVAKILNIGWIEDGIDLDARTICPRSGACPRSPSCVHSPERPAAPPMEAIRRDIVREHAGA